MQPRILNINAILLTLMVSMSSASAQMRVISDLRALPPVPAANYPVLPSAPAKQPRTSGTYVAEAMGATIVAQNVDYETVFQVSAMVPPGSTITKVAWRYGLSNKPVGFEAILCWSDQQPCWNVTNNNVGSTLWFNGKDARQTLRLHYRVSGSGSGALGPPSLGQMNQIIVTYDLPA